MMTSKSVAPPF